MVMIMVMMTMTMTTFDLMVIIRMAPLFSLRFDPQGPT